LWSFNWTGNQLRIKHYVEGINSKMTLGGLMPTINFDGITHGLKGMKREADRENNIRGKVLDFHLSYPGKHNCSNVII
jgi:hypothetical protein